MPKVSQEHLDARREQIVTAAMLRFAENGVHPTTIQEICREAKLSAGALYRYFRSKEDIVAAVAHRGREMIEATLAAARQEREPLRMLEKAVELFSGLFTARHGFYREFGGQITPEVLRRMNLMLRAEALRNPMVMAILATNYRKLQETVREMVAAAQALNSMFIGLEAQMAYDPELCIEDYVRATRVLLGR